MGWSTPVDPSPWTAYTPSVGVGSGSLTSYTVTGAYKQIGKTVHARVKLVITTNGTAGSYLFVTLPSTPVGDGAAIGVATPGVPVTAELTAASSLVFVRNTSAAYPGADGTTIKLSLTYEAP
jgi:hypothetical protein